MADPLQPVDPPADPPADPPVDPQSEPLNDPPVDPAGVAGDSAAPPADGNAGGNAAAGNVNVGTPVPYIKAPYFARRCMDDTRLQWIRYQESRPKKLSEPRRPPQPPPRPLPASRSSRISRSSSSSSSSRSKSGPRSNSSAANKSKNGADQEKKTLGVLKLDGRGIERIRKESQRKDLSYISHEAAHAICSWLMKGLGGSGYWC